VKLATLYLYNTRVTDTSPLAHLVARNLDIFT